ncbi:MAG: REC domain-containing phosphodiesterase, partial [Thioalkalivibrio sp.]|nr:REC domain-containing phosphodiesterase [Thioalkalivibrio sp.]
MINSISVLFVTLDPDLAGQVIGRIRYRGHAVRPKQAGNTRDLERLLQSHRFDAVVLIDGDMDIGLDELTEALHRAGRQTPIVMLTDRAQELRLSAVEGGAFAVVDTENHDVAAAMTLKAVEYLNKGREINHLRTLLQEADRRYLLMLDSSRNQPENVETCETLTLRTRRGQTFDADLLLTGAVIGGQPCTVVHLSFTGGEPTLQELNGPAMKPLGHDRSPGPPSGSERKVTPRKDAGAARTRPSEDAGPDEPGRHGDKAYAPRTSDEPRVAAAERQREFLRAVERTLADSARSERPLGLVVCALDISDKQPADAPDVLGSALQRTLAKGFPRSATVALLERGHCGILLSDTSRAEVEAQLDTLVEQIHGQAIPLDAGGTVTGSLACGAVLADDSESSALELLDRCQQALAEARTSGGGCYRFRMPPGIRQTDPEADMIWKTRIEEALDKNGLKLLYQPIVSLQGDDSPRYDVLVRLEAEGGETCEPNEFLPAAERSGVAAALDRWIIEHAVVALSGQLQRDPRTTFFVRLSQRSLDAQASVAWLQEFLERSQVPAGNVVVEFKEATILTQLDGAVSTAQGLKALGVGLCIGDFGNGLDPFKILGQVDAGYIKLDGGYVSRLANDHSAQDSVRKLTETAHADDRQVVVPMVEDADTLTLLFSVQVNLVQGYFVQPPGE